MKAFPLLLLVVLAYNFFALTYAFESTPAKPPAAQGEGAAGAGEGADVPPMPDSGTATAPDGGAAAADPGTVAGIDDPVFHALNDELFHIGMVSGQPWQVSLGDLFLMIGLALLFIELVRSTSHDGPVITNHALSLGVLVLCLVEFIVIPGFATSTFFLLMAMAGIDVVAGFIISIRGARRDFSFGGHTE